MRFKLIFIFSCFLISFSVFSQEAGENGQDNTVVVGQNDGKLTQPDSDEGSETIKRMEDLADKVVFEISGNLKKYSTLLKTKIQIIPYRVIFYKGKAEGDKCVLSEDQDQEDMNCLRIETYDFTFNTSKASSFKAYSKYMELYFNPATVQNNNGNPVALNKIITNAYIVDFSKNSTFLSEVVDNAPNSAPKHDDKIFLYSQKDGYPETKIQHRSGLGLTSLASIGNRDINPIRLNIKWNFYRKNLSYFEQILSKIEAFNLDNINKKYIDNLQNLQESLDF